MCVENGEILSRITLAAGPASYLLRHNTHKDITRHLATFPIIVICFTHLSKLCENDVLKHYDRTCEIHIMKVNGSALEKLATVMNKPFLAFTGFTLGATDESAPVFTEKFLG